MSFSGKPTTFVEQTIENDGFWPDLSVSEFQKEQRLPAEYLVELLGGDMTMAMIEVNGDLAKCKARWQAFGINNVEAADTVLLTIPSQLGVDYNLHILESFASYVAPALGWQPNTSGPVTGSTM